MHETTSKSCSKALVCIGGSPDLVPHICSACKYSSYEWEWTQGLVQDLVLYTYMYMVLYFAYMQVQVVQELNTPPICAVCCATFPCGSHYRQW